MMIVDDDVKTVWPLRASMEQAQHRVPFTHNGETARHIVRR
jgi:DNA-binding NtrC family response regulator